MSGRRRRQVKNDDSEEDDSADDQDSVEDADDESEDEEADGGEEEQNPGLLDAAVERPTAEVVKDIAALDNRPDGAKVEPKEILRRSNSEEQQQDRDRRDKNSRRKEMRREADALAQSQRKNPSFVPFSGNFFLHDDRDSNRLVGNEGDQPQLTEANLSKQAFDMNQQRTRKERPNTRERPEQENKGGGEKDMWRHDKFEELQATESPKQNVHMSRDRDRDQDAPQYGGGRGRGRDGGGRSGRGREGRSEGRGYGRGEGRGRGGRGYSNFQNVPVAADNDPQTVPQNVPLSTKNIPSNSASSSTPANSNTNTYSGNRSNSSNQNSSSNYSGRAETRKSPAPAPVAPQEQTTRPRERGSITTGGVFAAVQNRQRNALDRNEGEKDKDREREKEKERERERSKVGKDPAPQGPQSHPPISGDGTPGSALTQSQSQSQNHSQSYGQRHRSSQDVRQVHAPNTQRESHIKADGKDVRGTAGVIKDIAAAIENVTRIETDNKLALRAMKASAKEFRPTPSASTSPPGLSEGVSDDKMIYKYEADSGRSNYESSTNINSFVEVDNQGSRTPHSDLQNTSQSQNSGLSHTYPSSIYPSPGSAPHYSHSGVYEIPMNQLMSSPIHTAYTENSIYTENGSYPDAYMEGYRSGGIMYEIDDRLHAPPGMSIGTGPGHRHQVLITPPMGIDPRVSDIRGQIGGTTYYDKGGVTYYQDPNTYGEQAVQYGSPLGETFDPYRVEGSYDMHGQSIMMNGLGVTMGYDEMDRGGYYSSGGGGEADMMRDGRADNNHNSNGSTYYPPQQSGALIPYVGYSLIPATPDGPKVKPLDLDGKAKPFSPSLTITSTANSTFSWMNTGKIGNSNFKNDVKEVSDIDKAIEAAIVERGDSAQGVNVSGADLIEGMDEQKNCIINDDFNSTVLKATKS